MNKLDTRKKLSALLLLFLVGLVLVFAVQRVVQRLQPVPVREVPPLAVEVVTLQPAPFVITRRYTGTVAAAQAAELAARISSRVAVIHHREGDQVKKGELLISLDDTEQRNEVKRLQANGKRLRAEYAYWKNQFQRSIKLLKEKMISESVYEEALRMKSSLEASIEENTEALATARIKLDYAEIRAPFDARVKQVLTETGDLTLLYVRPLMELVSSGAMKAVVTVPQADLGQIRPGLLVQLRLLALDLLQQSRISRVYPALDTSTRNATFEALFADNVEEPAGLYSGMTVEATVVIQKYDAALTVPSQALVENRRGSGVFVVTDGRARWREVEAGERAAGRVRIHRGLRAGEQVVVTPDPRLDDGVAVELPGSAVEATP